MGNGTGDEAARPSAATIRSWRRMLADEQEEARVYRELAARRSGQEREILLELAEAERRHAAHWEGLLGDDIGRPRRGTPRMRILAFLARHFGWIFVLALVQRAENRSTYETRTDATASMAADERVHGEVVRALAARGRSGMSGTVRAIVFGVNDGLVSNIALVIGVIGGGAGTDVVLLTGLAGLLAGAISMAAGEYVSVSSQREMLTAAAPGESAQVSVRDLDVNANELALVYRARGLSDEEAERRAQQALLRSTVTPTARGADGHEVVGSGINAALSSFVAFATGALIPVLPFLGGLAGVIAVAVAAVLTGVALMTAGAIVGVLSGGSPLSRAMRHLVIGLGAALLTYTLGVAFGVTTG